MCMLEQHQDSDNLTLDEVQKKYNHREPRKICLREKKLITNFNELKSVIGGKACLIIYSGDLSSFSHPVEVGINLRQHNKFITRDAKVKKEHVDLYVLAHEFGHQAQVIHQRSLHKVASKRSKEANADYFAGFWIGVKLGENHGIDFKGLSKIAYNLKGGGDGENKYPYPEQREQLLLRGCGNAAALQLILNTDINELKKALDGNGIKCLWDASDKNLAEWMNNLL